MRIRARMILLLTAVLGMFVLGGVFGGLWLSGAMQDTNSIAYAARVQLAKWYWRIRGRDEVSDRLVETARVPLRERMIWTT